MSKAVIVIDTTTIRQDKDGRFNLNDLHKAAGGDPNHRPGEFLRYDTAKGLVAELENAGIHAIEANRGRYGGTFVGKELVYAYAMWISPAFNLKVIRAYDRPVREWPLQVDHAERQAAGQGVSGLGHPGSPAEHPQDRLLRDRAGKSGGEPNDGRAGLDDATVGAVYCCGPLGRLVSLRGYNPCMCRSKPNGGLLRCLGGLACGVAVYHDTNPPMEASTGRSLESIVAQGFRKVAVIVYPE